MFNECTSLEYLDLSNFYTSNVINMEDMFNGCYKLKEINGLNKFNTNKVLYMNKMFQDCNALTYLDLSNFNTSNVINMEYMFNRCKNLKEIKGINRFITYKVTNLKSMFQDCNSLESLDLSNFNISNFTNMEFMLCGCMKLKEVKGLKKLNSSIKTNMKEIFQSDNESINLNSSNFDSLKLSKSKYTNDLKNKLENMIRKNESKINNMKSRYEEFNKLKYFESNDDKRSILNLIYYQDENNIKNSKLRIFGKNFVNKNKGKCKIIYKNKQFELEEYLEDIDKNYNKKDLIKLKLKINNNFIDMSHMFDGCKTLLSIFENFEEKNQIFNFESINEINSEYYSLSSSLSEQINNYTTYSHDDFYKENNLFSLTISSIHNDNTKNEDIFPYSSLLPSINAINIIHLFNECNSLISLPDISKWNISNVKDMSYMFNGCKSLESLPDISQWKTSKVKDMSFIFNGCKSLVSLPDISKWDTSNVLDMSYMFNECSLLVSLPDISKWNTSNVLDMCKIFLIDVNY